MPFLWVPATLLALVGIIFFLSHSNLLIVVSRLEQPTSPPTPLVPDTVRCRRQTANPNMSFMEPHKNQWAKEPSLPHHHSHTHHSHNPTRTKQEAHTAHTGQAGSDQWLECISGPHGAEISGEIT